MAILKKAPGLSLVDVKRLHAMHPGMPVDLQITTPKGTKRVRTEFLGREGSRLLMLKFPDEAKWGSLRDTIFADSELIARYILEQESGEIVAFKTQVVFVLSKPIHMIFVNFPKAIQLHGLRSTKRTVTSVPVRLFDETNEHYLREGMIVDVSHTGCRIAVKKGGSGGEKLEEKNVLVVLDSHKKENQHLPAAVMNTRDDGIHYYYGLKFELSPQDVAQRLAELSISI